MRPARTSPTAHAAALCWFVRPALRLFFAVSLLISISASCCAAPNSDALSRFSYTEYHMGIGARIVVYAKDKSTAETACTAAYARIAQLEDIMSDYRPSSELMRLCAKAGDAAVPVSPELFLVLKRALTVSKQSDGAFDITCGPLISLWRAARKSGRLPASAEIETARRLVGWQKITLNDRNRTVKLAVPGMKLDLGGIAKGYAADCAQAVLKSHGIKTALVEMGGDIVVSDAPPGTEGWNIGVLNAGPDGSHTEMRLRNCAISTSGDTEQFVVIDGKRYSHIVDPRTGWALTNRVQVSLIAPNGLTSDPLTKTLCVLEPEMRAKVMRNYPKVKSFVKVLSLGGE